MTPPPEVAPGILEFPVELGVRRCRELLRAARTSKTCPVLLDPEVAYDVGGMPMPADPVGEIDATAPEKVLTTWSPSPCPPGCTCLEPFTAGFPTQLARVGTDDRSRSARTVRIAGELADTLAPFSSMALVEAVRPADVPVALAWSGTCNYRHQDLVGISAVLRSWEERFGALLVRMTRSTLELAVADPPRTRCSAEFVAAEHFAFCPDQHDPQDGTVYTPRAYARTIMGEGLWRFWWD